MKQPILTRGHVRRSGVIETISAGYAAVNRQPLLLLAPIVLDLFLWFGPRLSLAALAAEALAAPTVGATADPAAEQMVGDLRQATLEVVEGFNLFALLAVPIARSGAPSVFALLGGGGQAGDLMLRSELLLVPLVVGLLLLGLLWGGLYRAGLAAQVRGESATLPALARQGVLAAWRSALLLGLVVGAALLFAIPVAFAVALASLAAPALGTLLLIVAAGLALWVEVYLFFAYDAIYVRQVGPLAAVRDSIRVVRGSFWSALGFIALLTVILAGMGQVWQLLVARGPAGTVLAILGSAYIASGLAAASMVYLRERLAHGEPAAATADSAAG